MMKIIKNLKSFTLKGKTFFHNEKFNITAENITSLWDLQARGYITGLTMDEYKKIKNKVIKRRKNKWNQKSI